MITKPKGEANINTKEIFADALGDFVSLSKFRFSTTCGLTGSGKQMLNACTSKYTHEMAKQLVLESFLTPRARAMYKTSVEVAASSFTVCFKCIDSRIKNYTLFGYRN